MAGHENLTWRKILTGLPEPEQHRLLLDLVLRQVRWAVGDERGPFDPRTPFVRLGLGGGSTAGFRDALGGELGLALPTTLLFDHPSPARLADHLRTLVLDAPDHAASRAPAAAAAPSDDPIVIVAMACRFPGGVRSPEDLWRLVAEGRDAVVDIPTDRGWDLATHFDPDPGRSGTFYTTQGGFLDDVAGFDAAFFGISPREALAMDPQQRLLLEVSWEAFERAGIDPISLRGSRTGVYTGLPVADYSPPWRTAPPVVEGHLMSGTLPSVASGRVAYTLGLEGPALTIDTACSSSLTAMHLAAQALRAGECTLALAGGATVMSTPDVLVEFSRQRGLAPDGRCKSFADAADGTGWAEGAAVVLLERLSAARRHGRAPLAVLRASAVNSDGASNGLTAPNGLAQQRVIRAALASAGIAPSDVDVVEAHGTGTRLGDPIEAQAVIAAYGPGRPADRPLWLGSLKSNVGHTVGAAGVGGVIKMVLALRHGLLPRTLHVDEPSARVDWSAGHVRLLTEPVVWPRGNGVRRAGVSAFGVSGTNAHVIIEDVPHAAPVPPPPAPDRTGPAAGEELAWLLSAGSEPALREQAARLAARVDSEPRPGLADVGWSLAAGRAALAHHAVVVAGDREGMLRGLGALARGEPSAALIRGAARPDRETDRLAFLFSGQGSQRPGMGRALHGRFPAFAEAFDAVTARLDRHLPRPLRDVMFADSPPDPALERTGFTQPALFALEVALFRLLESWGVHPDLLLGHSVGELVAAHVAGVFDLDDACALVAARGRLMQAMPGGGAMVSLRASEERARELIAEWRARAAEAPGSAPAAVDVAAVNGPESVVVSGDLRPVEEIARWWRARGGTATRLRVSHAFHSAHMDGMLEEFRTVARGVTFRAPAVPVVSNVTGAIAAADELCSAEYWVGHVRAAVRFRDGVDRLRERGVRTFLEIGPDAVLCGMGHDCLPADSDAVFVPSLRRDEAEQPALARALGRLWMAGASVDWAAFFAGARRVDLPTYPFQHRRFWLGDHLATADTPTAGAAGAPAAAGLRRYRLAWTPVSVTKTATAAGPGRWLVVIPAEVAADGGTEGGVGGSVESCVRGLAGRGAEVVRFEVDLAVTDRSVLAARLAPLDPLTGVLSLLALDVRELPGRQPVTRGLAGTLSLVRALGDAGVEAPLWCVTRGAVSVGGADTVTSPPQAQVWGLGRVAALELPRRWGGLVDLPPAVDATAADRLAAILDGGSLDGGSGEDQLAIRPSGVFGRRLAPARTVGTGGGWRPRGTVLITGGTGALGAAVARWCADSGASRLVLTSRRGAAAPGVPELVADLARRGAETTVAACDAADRDALAAVLAAVPADCPLTAVVHAAGVAGGFTSLRDLDVAELAEVLAGKAAGARLLDELLGDRPLDAFVLFSSIAGTWGSGGQGAYSAGNAYLDAIAEHRGARGLTATALAWGPWAEGGMAVDPGIASHLRDRGLVPMPPDAAVAVLADTVGAERCLTVVDVDWGRFAPAFTAARPSPLLGDLPEVRAVLNPPDPSMGPAGDPAAGGGGAGDRGDGPAALLGRRATMRPAEWRRFLLDLVRAETAAVLGYDAAEQVPADRAFVDLGSTSLTAVQLRARLAERTGLRLPTTVVFDHPTSSALAEYLNAELPGGSGGPDGDAARAGAVEPAVTANPIASVPDPRDAAGDDPIVIVGMGCRLPGGVSSPAELWRLLADGTDAVSDFPVDRGWDVAGLYDPDPGRVGFSYVRSGGFLAGAGDFDAGFFGISPREALAMDPQQRLLLEVSWEALERAGVDPSSLRGSDTGVFTGLIYQGYGGESATASEGVEGYRISGTASSVASGRVAYVLGLEGPAVTVDTACSSSLVALHLAVRALRSGECGLALVGGVTVMSSPVGFVEFSRQRGLAVDGRVKAFAEGADGTGWGEGVGVLVVERLSVARARGHGVLAVVVGSAVNQDGASNGLTAPSGRAQERVIRAALADAGAVPGDVDVVEAHGTGTALGDPIEAGALLGVFGPGRPADRPLWLGSVKSNIGHTQAAAGVAGIIKIVQALRHQTVPATLHVDAPTSRVDWASGGVRVATERVAWPSEPGRRRRAGVSSFGMSGTNAHVVIEEAPPAGPDPEPGSGSEFGPDPGTEAGTGLVGAVPWILSARSEKGLRGQAARLLAHLDGSTGGPSVRDVGWSLVRGRAALEHRAVVLGERGDEDGRGDGGGRLAALRALAEGEPAEAAVWGRAGVGGEPRVVWVFPGQGAQWVGMGAGLLDSSPVFAGRIGECAVALAPFVDWSLVEVLRGVEGSGSGVSGTGVAGAGLLERVDVVQPVLWAVALGLAAVWESWGVRVDVVVGHSQGEVAAACVAGVLSLEEGARVVALRSRVIAEELAGGGGMVSVGLPVVEVEARLGELAGGEWAGGVGVAAVNGPSATVVAGETAVLEGLVSGWGAEGVRVRWLPVDYASHTVQVERVRDRLAVEFVGITPRAGDVAMWSTVTGCLVEPESLDGEYWFRNLRSRVRFDEAVRGLLAEGHRVFVELSPHPVLTAAITETAEAAETTEPAGASGVAETVTVVGSLRRGEGGLDRLSVGAARLWARGVPVDWTPLVAGGRPVELPTYAFQHRRYWPDTPAVSGGVPDPGVRPADHPMLSGVVPLVDTGGLLLTGLLSRGTHPWLADHAVGGAAPLPGAGFLELAVQAADQAGCDEVAELTLETALVVPEYGGVHLQVAVGAPDGAGRRSLAVYARPDVPGQPGDLTEPREPWVRHARGVLAVRAPGGGGAAPVFDLVVWPPPGARTVPVDDLYPRLAAAGVDYGPAFQAVRAVWRRGAELFAEVGLPEPLLGTARRFALHPVLVDAAFQPLVLDPELGSRRLRPFSWSDVHVFADGASTLRVRLAPVGADEVAVTLADGTGQPVAEGSLALRPAGPTPAAEAAAPEGTPPAESPDPPPASAAAVSVIPARRAAADGYQTDAAVFAGRLAGLAGPDREQALLDLVRGHAAAVLGHEGATAVADDRSFRDLGFDSLSGVELRDRLTAVTGLRLPAALVFNHPTPRALAGYLRAGLEPGRTGTAAALAELDRLEAALGASAADDRTVLTERLQALLWRWTDTVTGPAGGADVLTGADGDDFESMTDDEMLEVIDRELGAL
ncbi:type I polyketide synthase [Parafrankia discariae]|uniref:type I polyketide synthase n=1 Tax=Parafrankia discariae TaxID=365528 RepID=UPI0003681A13|nr:type I polyketide synthase [Parafrankia discariae]